MNLCLCDIYVSEIDLPLDYCLEKYSQLKTNGLSRGNNIRIKILQYYTEKQYLKCVQLH